MRTVGGTCSGVAALSSVASLPGRGTDRIERPTGASPDNGDGSLELAWVVVPLVVAAYTTLAGRDARP